MLHRNACSQKPITSFYGIHTLPRPSAHQMRLPALCTPERSRVVICIRPLPSCMKGTVKFKACLVIIIRAGTVLPYVLLP